MGIDVLPPDVNYSGLDFEIQERPADTAATAHRDPQQGYAFPVPEGSAIRFGMAAVKNVGEGPVQVIIEARKAGGPFASLEDFCDRVDLRQCNKRALECLVKVGAFDRFGKRSQLLDVIDQMVAHSAGVHSARESGQLSMFDLLGGAAAAEVAPIRLPDLEEVKGRDRLQWEKELLGVYAMSHPLHHLSVDLKNMVTCACNELDVVHDGKNVLLAGMIAGVRTITTKKGDLMAFVQLEDMQGQCEVVVFPRTYAEAKDKLVPDNVVLIKGKAQTREGQTSLLADSIQTYVDVPIAKEDEALRYQQPLLDTGPTINGEIVAERRAPIYNDAQADAGGLDDDAFDDDGFFPPADENPFRDDPPVWMDDEPQPVSQPARSPAAQGVGKGVKQTNGSHVKASQAKPAPQEKAETVAPEVKTQEPDVPASPRKTPSEALQPSGDQEKPTKPQGVKSHTKGAAKIADESPAGSSGNAATNGDKHSNGHNNGEARTNGHTNGHTHSARQEPRTLHITFRRSGDLDRDKFRLKEIYDTVRDPRGRDRFRIVLKIDGVACTLAFPNDPCTISERLTGELTTHFRVDVKVEEQEQSTAHGPM